MDHDYLVICAIGKNEAPYVLEWCCYHLSNGVDRIYYHDNGSDNTEAILKPLIDQDLVIYRKVSRPKPQMYVYNNFNYNKIVDTRWCAYIDVDEFIVPKTKQNITEELKQFEDLSALAIAWKVFGSSFVEKRNSKKLVMETYIKCSTHINDDQRPSHYKTIADPKCTKTNLNNPHIIYPRPPKVIKNELREIVRGPFTNYPPSHKYFQLNHYYTKSYEDWERKMKRGGGNTPDDKYPLKLAHFKHLEKALNETECHAIMRFVDGTKKFMENLLCQ